MEKHKDIITFHFDFKLLRKGGNGTATGTDYKGQKMSVKGVVQID